MPGVTRGVKRIGGNQILLTGYEMVKLISIHWHFEDHCKFSIAQATSVKYEQDNRMLCILTSR